MKPTVKGRIGTQLTIFCGKCNDWQYLKSVRKVEAYKEARQKGWKLTKQYGWVCPIHSRKSDG